ncbi:hypothetical protein T484DRAFT_1952901 [Baffinella frigidus]|nr:hypothetical protein T484DRAFT_1952901 [Cryptophyta sp. CCMP2293]
MCPETRCLFGEKTMSGSGGGVGLNKMAWAEEQNITCMAELDRKLQALTLQENHKDPSSSSRHCEQSDDVADGSDAQRLFDEKALLALRAPPGRKYEGPLSRAGTVVSAAHACCNEAAVDEGAATKAAPAVASASGGAARVTWKRVVVGDTAEMPIISADTRWLRLMGLSRQEIRGKSLQIVCGPKSALSTVTKLLAKATPATSSPSWLPLYHKSGQEIWLIVRATLRIESGERCVALEMQPLDPAAKDEEEEDPEDAPRDAEGAAHSPAAAQRDEFVRSATPRRGSAADVEDQRFEHRFEHRERRLLAVLADAERSFARCMSSPRSS